MDENLAKSYWFGLGAGASGGLISFSDGETSVMEMITYIGGSGFSAFLVAYIFLALYDSSE